MARSWPAKLVAQMEQPVLNHSAREGRISGLPWQQLRASLSVWPPTAAAPDWLPSPSSLPRLLRRTLTSSSLRPSGRACKGSARLGASALCQLATLAPCVSGVTLMGLLSTLPWVGCPSRSGYRCKRSLASEILTSLRSPQTLVFTASPLP